MKLSQCRDFDDLRQFLNSGDPEPKCFYIQDGKVKTVWVNDVRFLVNEDVDAFDWAIVSKNGKMRFWDGELYNDKAEAKEDI